jgi:PAS domain S-box-containing protein
VTSDHPTTNEIREVADRLDDLLASTEVAALFLDDALRIRWFTPAFAAAAGLDAAHIGEPVQAEMSPVLSDDLTSEAAAALAHGRVFDREVAASGDRAYLRRTAPRCRDGDRPDGLAVTLLDISDRKNHEREADAARNLAQALVETAREPLIVLAFDLTVRSANDAFCRRFDLRPEDSAGRRIYDLGNGQWNIPRLRELLDEVLQAGEARQDFVLEHRFDGLGPRVMLLNARRIDDLQLVLLAIEDVTERTRAEQNLRDSDERFRVLVESMAQAIWESDAAGVITTDSASWRASTGQTLEEYLGDGWLDVVHPDDRSRTEKMWRDAIASVRPLDMEFRMRNSADAWCWTNLRAAPIRHEPGGVTRWVGMNLDITDRKEAEIERELLARELSHRVKNTLAVVQALALQTNGRLGSASEYRAIFIGRLQALSQAQSLVLDAHSQRAELTSLVERSLATYVVDHPQAIEIRGVSVILTAKQSLGLALILHELGTNAAKFGALSQQEGRLRVSWQVVRTDSRDRVRLCWQERDGPTVTPPAAKGFGTQLIEQASGYELDGQVELGYAPGGLTCTLEFPLEE